MRENQIGSKPVDGTAIRGGAFNQINNAVNMAHAVQQNMKLMTSPDTSLEWYKVSLQTSVPSDVLYERLMIFYDTLASMNIHPTY